MNALRLAAKFREGGIFYIKAVFLLAVLTVGLVAGIAIGTLNAHAVVMHVLAQRGLV